MQRKNEAKDAGFYYPWQESQWNYLTHAKNSQRLSHAFLCTGIAGIGKLHFVIQFIREYCHQNIPADENCQCHSCRLIQNKSHPNILWIEPEKIGAAIKIDQIRELSEFVQQTSLQKEFRIVIIHPAHAMNINAANALLKTLEEPTQNSYLFLISDQASQLPATILSRCQRIIFPRPTKALALSWLKKQFMQQNADVELLLRLSNGAPLTAIKLIESEILKERTKLYQILCLLVEAKTSPISAVSDMKEMDLIQWLDFIIVWIMDLIQLQLGCSQQEIKNIDFVKKLSQFKQTILLSKVMAYMEYLQQMRTEISSGINLNKQLMMETILIRWMECAECF